MAKLLGPLVTFCFLPLVFLVLSSCASKPKPEEPVEQPVAAAAPTVVIKRVPEKANDLQIVTAARDLFALAGIETRALEIESRNGLLVISGEAEPSRELNQALALMSKIKGVREVQANIESGTVSGSTSAVEEAPSLVSWFVTLFWPILALIGAAFLAIGFLFLQTRYIHKQILQKRELAASR